VNWFNKNVKYVLFGLITTIWFACTKTGTTYVNASVSEEIFQENYLSYKRLRFAPADSLFKLYKHIDSLNPNLSKSKIAWLKFFVKTIAYQSNGNHIQACKSAHQSISCLPNDFSNDTLKAMTFNSLGNSYKNTSIFDSAAFYYTSALKIFEAYANGIGANGTRVNMAGLYNEHQQPDSALQLTKKIIDADVPLKMKLIAWHTRANAYIQKKIVDSALAIDYRIIGTYKNGNECILLSPFYNNIAMTADEKGQLDTALFYCRLSYHIDSSNGNKRNMAANLMARADIFTRQNQLLSAKAELQKALLFLNTINSERLQSEVYNQLANIAQKEENTFDVMRYKDSSLAVFKRINKVEVDKKIAEYNLEYDTEKKNTLIEKQQLKLKNSTILLASVIMGFLLLAVLMFHFFQNHRKKQKLNLLQQQEQASLLMIDAEQKERMRIARELHDGIGQKLTVLRLYASIEEEKNKKNIELLDSTIKDVRDLSHNLMPEILNLGLFKALKSLCDMINQSEKVTCELIYDEAAAAVMFSKEIEMSVYRIVQEVINNMLKHAQATKITVRLLKGENNYRIYIQDNGVGFQVKSIHQSKGIGWSNIFTRAKIINAEIELDSSSKGTNIQLNIHL
jgi:two-component system, NarL family, sensor kinase